MNPSSHDYEDVLELAAELRAAGRPFAFVTVVRCESPTSAKPGAKAVVEPDGSIHGWIGGGCAQPAVIKTARQAIEDGEARLIRISPDQETPLAEGIIDFSMSCHSGGTLDIFVDPVVARPQLLVLGGSPAAAALVGLARRTGFEVSAAAPGIDVQRFGEAERVIDGLDPAALATPTAPYVVVATQGRHDERALEAAVSIPARGLWFVASARKADKLKAFLAERGHDQDRIDAIVAPAGIEIGAVSPEEIALSVLAAVVAERRSGNARPQPPAVERPRPEPVAATGGCCGASTDALSTSAEASDPACGMSVDTATAEHRSVHGGTTC